MAQSFAQVRPAPALRAINYDRICSIGIPMLAMILFLLSTHHGIGIFPDSARYMDMAPLPWDAPLYPAVLQTLAWTGLDIVTGAWIFGLLLAPLNAYLTWAILREATGRLWHAAAGALLIVIAPQTVGFHALAMSEPLFLSMILLTLLALGRYLQLDNQRWLIAAGCGIGLASLARFTGPALGAAIALFLLMLKAHSLSRRISDVLHVFLPSATLFIGWAVLSELTIGRSTGRPLQWYGNLTANDWLSGFSSLTAWVAPDELPLAVRGTLLVVGMMVGTLLLIRMARSEFAVARTGTADMSLIAVPLAIFFCTYLVFMVLATSIEANLHLNGRYAYPIYCTTIMAFTIALGRTTGGGRWVQQLSALMVALALITGLGHMVRTAHRTHQAWRDGIGFASRQWVQSPTLAAVSRLPREAMLYSNGADAIGYVLRRRALYTPAYISLRIGRQDPANPYWAQVARTRAALARGNVYIVLLNRVDWRFYMVPERELVRQLNLRLVGRYADGAIYTSGTAADIDQGE